MYRARDRDGEAVHLGFLEPVRSDRNNPCGAGIDHRGRTRHCHVERGFPDEEGGDDPLAAKASPLACGPERGPKRVRG
jgi:hypothetical protein